MKLYKKGGRYENEIIITNEYKKLKPTNSLVGKQNYLKAVTILRTNKIGTTMSISKECDKHNKEFTFLIVEDNEIYSRSLALSITAIIDHNCKIYTATT